MAHLNLIPGSEVIEAYRRIFSTGSGQLVLKHMLAELRVFYGCPNPDDPKQAALQNYGRHLLDILSGGEIAGASIDQFTKLLMKQPLPKGDTDHD